MYYTNDSAWTVRRKCRRINAVFTKLAELNRRKRSPNAAWRGCCLERRLPLSKSDRRVTYASTGLGSGPESSHTASRMTDHVEVTAPVFRRRRWTAEQKLPILQDAFSLKGSVRSAFKGRDNTKGKHYGCLRKAKKQIIHLCTPLYERAFNDVPHSNNYLLLFLPQCFAIRKT